MKKILMVLAVTSGVLSIGTANADAGADLVKSKGCLVCHAAAEKKVGPSFKDTAAKYKGKMVKNGPAC